MAFEKIPEPVELARLSDLAEGSMKLVRAGGHRLCLVRTSEGVFALENACPHEGYGLVQGDLDGDELICEWHNWRFRVRDGACVLGEEGVATHPVRVEGERVLVNIQEPDPAAARPVLAASLRRGIEEHYVGQISRDVVRLLRADVAPVELVWEAVAWGAPRAEFGFGHALASAHDCLALADRVDGDARALPVVQAITGITEVEHLRPLRPSPEPLPSLPPDAAATFRRTVEQGWSRVADAEALLRTAIEEGTPPDELRRWLLGTVADHHLGYGHGAIYVRKAFELLDRLGWDRAATVLPSVVVAHLAMTREDRLPYMRPFVRAMAAVDVTALIDREPEDGWVDGGSLEAALLGGPAAEVPAAVERAVRAGAGIEGILDAVALAASERLLRYDPRVDFDLHEDFGWLDITHALTYADAARWAWRAEPGPDTARLALWTAFLASYSGRRGYREVPDPPLEPVAGDVGRAVAEGRADDAARAALAGDRSEAAATLEQAALSDLGGSFIVAAHLVKTACAAGHEAEATGSNRPLAAAARFLASPRMERFVASDVTRSVDFLSGRGPGARS